MSLCIFAQNNLDEVVYLKNGSIIRGTIIEQIPNEKLKIQTNDGNVFVYNFAEIEKITKEAKIVSPQAYNTNSGSTKSGLSKEIIQHRNKGIALTVTGTTLFSIGMPFLIRSRAVSYYGGSSILLGRLIPGVILVGAGFPMMIIGPVQLGKFSKLKKESTQNSGLFLNPSIVALDNSEIPSFSNSKDLSVGFTLTYKF